MHDLRHGHEPRARCGEGADGFEQFGRASEGRGIGGHVVSIKNQPAFFGFVFEDELFGSFGAACISVKAVGAEQVQVGFGAVQAEAGSASADTMSTRRDTSGRRTRLV